MLAMYAIHFVGGGDTYWGGCRTDQQDFSGCGLGTLIFVEAAKHVAWKRPNRLCRPAELVRRGVATKGVSRVGMSLEPQREH